MLERMGRGALAGAVVGALAVGWMPSADANPVLTLDPAPPAYTRVVNLTGSIGGVSQSATATLEVLTFTSNALVINFSIKNTTPTNTAGTNRLVTFGFDVTPTNAISGVTADTAVSGWSANFGANPNVPSYKVDICVFDGQNCAGGSNDGIGEMLTESFKLTFSGTFNTPPTLALDRFVARFQSAGEKDASGVLTDYTITIPDDPGTDPENIPEPVTLALFGMGLAGLGVAMRRRRREGGQAA